MAELKMVSSNKLRTDSAGLLYHLSDCVVRDDEDIDDDCTCGAHAINQRLNENERLREQKELIALELGRKIGENEQLKEKLSKIRKVVDKQAEDDGLWFVGQTAAEAYLQQEFRKLHHVVELNT